MSAIKNPAEGTPTIRVEIYNQTYNIRSDGDSEYVIGLAEFVDRRMREISSGTLTVDSLKVAILAALHVARADRPAARRAQRRVCRDARPRPQDAHRRRAGHPDHLHLLKPTPASPFRQAEPPDASPPY
jgi:cell division protein ZapA